MAATTIKNGFNGGSDAQLLVNPDGSINVNSTGGGGSSNVSIVEGGNTAVVTPGGALEVSVVPNGTPISQYNEVTGVAMNASVTILTYTVPIGHTLQLNAIEASSDSISTIELDLNGTANAKGRLCYTNYNLRFGYNNYSLAAGTVVNIVGTNYSLQGVASFNATLQGIKVELLQVQAAKASLELRIEERLDEIERIKDNIRISENKEKELMEKIGGLNG
jgi:hypothetical protein